MLSIKSEYTDQIQLPTRTERQQQSPSRMLPHLPPSFSLTTCKAAGLIPSPGLQAGADQEAALLPSIHQSEVRQSRTNAKHFNIEHKLNANEQNSSVGGGGRCTGIARVDAHDESPEIGRTGDLQYKEQ